MGTTNCPEIRELAITTQEKAAAYDSRVREIDRIVRESWSELAAICIQVRDKVLWRHMDVQHESFDAWLLDAAPVCRATVYRGMGVLSVLAKDLSPSDIAGMEIGNASILAYEVSSPHVRRDPEVIEAAKSHRHSRKLRDIVKTKYPEQHMEDVVEKKLHFTSSQWSQIEAAYDAYLTIDSTASLETFIEWMVSETWLDRD